MRPSSVKSTRTTVYINDDIKLRMNALIKKHLVYNQTAFINSSLQEKISKLEKDIAIEQIIKKMRSFKRIKSKKTSTQMIRELRDDRANRMTRLTKENKKTTKK